MTRSVRDRTCVCILHAAERTVSVAGRPSECCEFLDRFYRIYGSFIPLRRRDLLEHLKRKLNVDFSERETLVLSEVAKYKAARAQRPGPSFLVVYKKHRLTLDDLSTLADQNWLNDQVINMYGELIMESTHHKVHFLNSFFHQQLEIKGYEGVKRWTKQVDLFSKSLLFVPIHLEVHWCLVTADTVKKRIYLYDSQDNEFQEVAQDILEYLTMEAKERQQTSFQSGWMVSVNKRSPQQTNENDCGVFVLEFCRCLALEKPLHFSQKDIPSVRKRIYKELCDCKLQE
ncbi:sentrin-specific protease 5-like [Polymixia lowei]